MNLPTSVEERVKCAQLLEQFGILECSPLVRVAWHCAPCEVGLSAVVVCYVPEPRRRFSEATELLFLFSGWREENCVGSLHPLHLGLSTFSRLNSFIARIKFGGLRSPHSYQVQFPFFLVHEVFEKDDFHFEWFLLDLAVEVSLMTRENC